MPLQPLLMPMITRWGRIVNVSSIAALIGGKRGDRSTTPRWGALNSATKALALAQVATRGG